MRKEMQEAFMERERMDAEMTNQLDEELKEREKQMNEEQKKQPWQVERHRGQG